MTATAVIVLATVFFAGMGTFALVRPSALIQPFGILLVISSSEAKRLGGNQPSETSRYSCCSLGK